MSITAGQCYSYVKYGSWAAREMGVTLIHDVARRAFSTYMRGLEEVPVSWGPACLE